jgi:hypothetical protein
MSESREQQSMIVVPLSQTWLLFSSLRHDCCSPLSDMILVLLSQTWLLFSSLRQPTIISERGEQQSCMRENNNHVWQRRTTLNISLGFNENRTLYQKNIWVYKGHRYIANHCL